MKTNPLAITGPWDSGITLDVHTTSAEYLGDDIHGKPQFDTVRSELGEALYQCKYRGDKQAGALLGVTAAAEIRNRGLQIDIVVPVPPSKARSFQPLLAIAQGVAEALGAEYDPVSLKKVKETAELKSMSDVPERVIALADAFAVDRGKFQGKRVLLLDDLYRSGATMTAVARTVRGQGHATEIHVLALTRTRTRT